MRLLRPMWSLLLLVACATAQGSSVPAPPAIPTLDVTTFDGARWRLVDHRGTWVVVNFWATWCKPCIKEIPDLSALDTRRDDLSVIGLAYEEIEPADLKAFLVEHPAAYPIAVLDVYAPPADFATPRGLPMTYLIAPDGVVAKQFLGPVTARELEQAIDEHAPKAPIAAGG